MCLHFRFRGLTRIELVVVVVVVTILAGVLLPIIDEAREKSKRATCLSHLRQIGRALVAYTQDFDSVYPQEYPTCPNPARGVAREGDFDGSLERADYGSPYRQLVPFMAGFTGTNGNSKRQLFVCPDDPDPYGLSLPGCGASIPSPGVNSYVVNAYFLFGLRAALVEQPADTIYMAERNTKFCDIAVRPWLGEIYDAPDSVGKVGGDIPYPSCIIDNPDIDQEFAIASERHALGSNYTFADGHVKWELYLDTIAPVAPDQSCFGQYQALREDPGPES